MVIGYGCNGRSKTLFDGFRFRQVNVSSRDASAFDRVNVALNLPPRAAEVDLQMLGEMQKGRWARMNEAKERAEADTKAAGEAAAQAARQRKVWHPRGYMLRVALSF
jgi:hypothetical protein